MNAFFLPVLLVFVFLAFRADLRQMGWVWPQRVTISREALELYKALASKPSGTAVATATGSEPAFLDTTEEPNQASKTSAVVAVNDTPAYVRKGKEILFFAYRDRHGDVAHYDEISLKQKVSEEDEEIAAERAEAEQEARVQLMARLDEHVRLEALEQAEQVRDEKRQQRNARRRELREMRAQQRDV